MTIKTFSVGDHVWVMHDNKAIECEVIAVKIDCFFGSERINGGDMGEIQGFTDEATIGMGVKYTLRRCDAVSVAAIKVIHSHCFKTKEELIKTL